MSYATGSPADLLAPPGTDEAPYPGPRPFSTAERDRFFGRRDEVLDLVSLVRAHQAVLIYAPSGVGKSSLVEAGLRPQLEARGRCVVYPTTRVRGPVAPIPRDMVGNVYVRNVLTSLDPAASSVGFGEHSLASALGGLRSREAGGDSMQVVIVDQLEELFTFHPERWRDRREFFQEIQYALDADPLLRVLLVLRDDYLARLKPHTSAFSDDLRTQYALERLRRDAALDAITLPTRGSSRTFSDDAAELLVDSLLAVTPDAPEGPVVLGEFVEPVELQVVCLDLWQRLPADVSTITAEHVREFARIGEVLARFYDDSVAATVKRARVPEKQVRAWVERSLITPSGTRGLVFRDTLQTGGLPNPAVAVLEERRIIRSEQRGGSQWYELTHDRLVNAVRDSNRRWGARRTKRLRRRWVAAGVAVLVVLLVVAAAVVARHLLRDDPVPNLMSLGERTLGVDGTFSAKGERGMVLFHVHPDVGADATVELSGPQGDVVRTISAQCPAGVAECEGEEGLVDLPTEGMYRVRVTSLTEGKVLVGSQRAWYGEPLAPDKEVHPPDEGSPDDVRLHRLHSEEAGVAIVVMDTEAGSETTDPVDLEARSEEGRWTGSAEATFPGGATLFLTLPGNHLIRPVVGERSSYRLTLSITPAPPLRPGYETGVLDADGVRAHRVDLAQGDVALFEVTSENFSPAVLALSPDGGQMNGFTPGRSLGGGSGRDEASAAAFLGIKAPVAGTYYVVVLNPTLDSERGYRLSYNHISGLQT